MYIILLKNQGKYILQILKYTILHQWNKLIKMCWTNRKKIVKIFCNSNIYQNVLRWKMIFWHLINLKNNLRYLRNN